SVAPNPVYDASVSTIMGASERKYARIGGLVTACLSASKAVSASESNSIAAFLEAFVLSRLVKGLATEAKLRMYLRNTSQKPKNCRSCVRVQGGEKAETAAVRAGFGR